VRYDGGHKRNDLLVDTLGQVVQFVPVCPEVEVGLGVPRPTLRLVMNAGQTRLRVTDTGADQTHAMRRYARRRTAGLARQHISGYVLKKNSPSCGIEGVPVHGANGILSRNGRGLFARALLERYPNLPVEDEGRLNDPRLRENFIERVFAYRRLRSFFASRWTLAGLLAFHAAHELQLMAHAPSAWAKIGALIAGARKLPRAEIMRRYESVFMQALKRPATRARHAKVLRRAMGCLRGRIDHASRMEILALIEDYRLGLRPLIEPLSLVRHYARLYDVGYLKGQYYLEPDARELMLRNHV
jgi:uncharacterized protein YbgA (DUF1722 family)/uncharacterized protein YbbK (DUF523 family)